jgi:hypothetical protein
MLALAFRHDCGPTNQEVTDDRLLGGCRVASWHRSVRLFLITRKPHGRDGAYSPVTSWRFQCHATNAIAGAAVD